MFLSHLTQSQHYGQIESSNKHFPSRSWKKAQSNICVSSEKVYAGGIALIWPSSPATGLTQLILSGANNSDCGIVELITLTSSRIPALMIRIPSMPPKLSPYLPYFSADHGYK
jgi:hypothetical protein